MLRGLLQTAAQLALLGQITGPTPDAAGDAGSVGTQSFTMNAFGLEAHGNARNRTF